nr:oligosaccharide flippase family protein [Priestia taiwanensis]
MWKGAAILTISALFLKILSAMYRIPYQNMVGDVGYYIYQQVYPFFGVGVTLATYGFPIVIAKMIADKREEGKNDEIREIVKVSLYALSIVGVVIFVCLFVGAEAIASFMGDENLTSLIQVIAFYFLLFPLISVLRGYFQGKFIMMPTAMSQVAEQIIRVGVILCASYVMIRVGFNSYEIGSAAISGSVFGAIAAVIVLVLYRRKEGFSLHPRGIYSSDNRKMMKYILVQGITICICNLVLVLIQLVDASNFYSLLVDGGMGEEISKEMKGVYDRSLPLVQVGTVVATSIALALVPQLGRGSEVERGEKITLVIKFCFVFSIGATIGLACIAEPTNIMLYKNDKGTNIIVLLSFSILLSSLAISTAAILQGLNETIRPAIHVIGGIILKWIGNMLLIPFFGIEGAAIATLISLCVIVLLNIKSLQIITTIQWKDVFYIVFKSGWAACLMAICVTMYVFVGETYMNFFEHARANAAVQSLSAAMIGGFIYLILLVRLRVIEETEMSMFIKNKKVKNFISWISGR